MRRSLSVGLVALLGACTPAPIACPNPATCATPEPDAGEPGCSSDTQCAAPLGRCLVDSRTCVACLEDGDCAAGVCDAELHTCALQPDSCATAQRLMVGGGTVEVLGDTTRSRDDSTLSCALPGSQGNDLVYTFQLDRPQKLIATAVALPGSALVPVLGLRSVCNSIDANHNSACAYGTTNAGATLSTELSAGTWYLWLDGEGATAGAFKLTVTLSDTNAGTCNEPIELLAFNSQRSQAVGDTRGETDDARGLCGGAGAPENVFAFEIGQPQRVSIELEPLSADFAPALYVRGSACTDATPSGQLSCAVAMPGAKAVIDLPRLPAGRYHVVVDGAGATPATSAGPYRLTVSRGPTVPPPANDTCAGAVGLPPPMNGIGVVTVQGDTSAANHDALGCTADGPDVVYRLELSGPRRVSARVQPLSGSSLRPAVYLRRPNECDSQSPANQLGCAASAIAGAPSTLTLPSLPAGSYFVWVDGQQGTSGAFELSVDLAVAPAAPENDVCAEAPQLALASGVVTASGTTVSAGDDVHLWCTEPLGAFSPDVVYTIDVPVRQAMAIDVTAPAGSPLLPVFSLRPPMKCDSDALLDNPSCAWADPLHVRRSVLSLPDVAPGRYSLWVEGDGSTQGAFSVRVVTSPPVPEPENDWCGSTVVPTLAAGVPVSGDTRGAVDDSTGACSAATGANGEYGRDVLYRFSVTQTQNVKLTVTPEATTGALFRPLVYVKASSACASTTASATLGCAAAADFGESVVLNLNALPAGTYNVWVDGAGLSSGSFSIRLQ
ncbi:MAG: hypothetical protein JNK82_16970 [Myxococcaceae bacterium]|nr:hypothetical protein [Myxococcaceae bacterium]